MGTRIYTRKASIELWTNNLVRNPNNLCKQKSVFIFDFYRDILSHKGNFKMNFLKTKIECCGAYICNIFLLIPKLYCSAQQEDANTEVVAKRVGRKSHNCFKYCRVGPGFYERYTSIVVYQFKTVTCDFVFLHR